MNTGGSTAHVTLRRKQKVEALVEICSVRVGTALFGVPIGHILEIVGGVEPLRVPLAPDYVGGLVHYRGDVLTTVSLRQLLDLPPREAPQAVLVIESVGGCFGVLVDSVCEVLHVSAADYEPNPSILGEQRAALLGGAYKLKETLLVMLDPERLDPSWLAARAQNSTPVAALRREPCEPESGPCVPGREPCTPRREPCEH
jgi:purine-binding chemotaxis protein CheW